MGIKVLLFIAKFQSDAGEMKPVRRNEGGRVSAGCQVRVILNRGFRFFITGDVT